MPIVVTELEFRNVQHHVFLADLVEGADYAALDDGPEAFNGLSMDRANYIFFFRVVNNGMRERLSKMLIADPLISADQAYLVGYSRMHELFERDGAHAVDDASDDVALRFTAPTTAILPEPMPPVPRPRPRWSLCLFFARPPMKVSSTSTMPPSFSSGAISAARILWHMECAVS